MTKQPFLSRLGSFCTRPLHNRRLCSLARKIALENHSVLGYVRIATKRFDAVQSAKGLLGSGLCAFILLLSACTPVGALITAGSTAGSLAMEERGLDGATTDFGLKADVLAKWADANLSYTTDLTVILYDRRALITGAVETETQRAEAIRLVWQTEGIEDVYNEIQLQKEWSLQDFAHDTWIGTKLAARTTFDSQILDSNYKTEVEGGTLYIIGLAQSQGELNRFIAHAKSLSYVRKIVSHVRIKPRPALYKAPQ